MQPEKAYMEFRIGKKSKGYTVQFNPTELVFEASVSENKTGVSEREEKQNFQICQKKMPKPILARKPATMDIIMSVNLILDQSLDEAGSVQQEAEGLIAAARKTDLKEIIFQWGNLNFTGKLEGASAEYTMFHPSGAPARATVRMTIRKQGDGESEVFYEEQYKRLFQRGHI